jgi:hypothetical protein
VEKLSIVNFPELISMYSIVIQVFLPEFLVVVSRHFTHGIPENSPEFRSRNSGEFCGSKNNSEEIPTSAELQKSPAFETLHSSRQTKPIRCQQKLFNN